MSYDEKEVRADKVKPEPIVWLWPFEANLPDTHEDHRPGRIPRGMLTTLAGRPGEGKSTLTSYLAAEVSIRKGERSGVLFSNMEDPVAQVLRPRLESAGADLRNVHFFNFRLPREESALNAAIESLEAMIYRLNIGLVIADPIAAHLGASLYNDQDTRRILTPVTKMLARTSVAMLAVAHTNKHVSKNAHPLSAIGGSGGGLVGASRAVYVFGKDPRDETVRILAPAKFNIGPMSASVAFDMDDEEWIVGSGDKAKVIRSGKLAHLTDEHPTTAIEVLSAKPGDDEGPPAEKKAIAAEWLTGFLATGGKRQTDVRREAADTGISWMTLRRAADEVGVVKARRGSRRGSYVEWLLPDNHPALKPDAVNASDTPDATAPDATATPDAPAAPDGSDMSAFEAMLDATDSDDSPDKGTDAGQS